MQTDQQLQEPELSQEHSDDDTNLQDSKQPVKIFMPPEYNKAKRNVTKLINNYFAYLKEEIKAGAKLYLDRQRVREIEAAITAYIGLRYNDKKLNLDLKLKLGEESKSKQNRSILLSYISEAEKIISYNHAARVNVININKGQYRLPDIATPIAFQNSIYFLDPCNYDLKRKVFAPEGPAFCIGNDGKLRQISPPIFFRSRSAIVRQGQWAYLIGGEATERKITTNRCQKYHLKKHQSIEMLPMNHKHKGPSACFLGQNLWVFSMHEVEMYDGKEWIDVGKPFTANFLPFQFLLPINDQEILIFGGTFKNQKSKDVHIYNTKFKNINSYGRLLPQGISNQRSSGASVIHGCVAALSSIQASVYPQVGVKSNMSEVMYIFESSAYLNSIITL